jgi:hypothetical protein
MYICRKINTMSTTTKKRTTTKKATVKKPKAGSYEAVLEAVEFAKKTGLAKTYGK